MVDKTIITQLNIGEERQIDNFDEINIDKERQILIDDCNTQVDRQVEDIVKTFLK